MQTKKRMNDTQRQAWDALEQAREQAIAAAQSGCYDRRYAVQLVDAEERLESVLTSPRKRNA